MIGAIIVSVAKFIPFPDEGDVLLTWSELGPRGGNALAMIFAAYIVLRWIDRRPFALLGLNLLQGWWLDVSVAQRHHTSSAPWHYQGTFRVLHCCPAGRSVSYAR